MKALFNFFTATIGGIILVYGLCSGQIPISGYSLLIGALIVIVYINARWHFNIEK